MINRDFPNHDVKENVKDFPNHELCRVIVQNNTPLIKTIAPQFKQLHLTSNNCTSLKTKVTMVNQGRSAHYTLLTWLRLRKTLVIPSAWKNIQLFVLSFLVLVISSIVNGSATGESPLVTR